MNYNAQRENTARMRRELTTAAEFKAVGKLDPDRYVWEVVAGKYGTSRDTAYRHYKTLLGVRGR